MRRALQVVLLLLGSAGASAGQVVIDRIVATVNGQPILQSDWDVALRCEALLDRKEPQFTPEAARGTLERLIDQELLRQQIRTFQLKPIGEEELHKRMQEIRKQIPGAADDAGWQAALRRYGLTQSEVDERITDELEILRFIDVRLRPTVHVNRRSIEEYYRDKLLPQLKQKGAKEVPLVEVSRQIEEILSQELMDTQLADLLRDLRQQSEIHIQPSALPPPPGNSTAGSPQQAQTPRLPGIPAERR
ncbi:MAG: SurA N-terminal domain-containing protein [Acidobacteriia bacterium]|nr:SurA N-terminal domain-containing protein [Terriglobia bacterium]